MRHVLLILILLLLTSCEIVRKEVENTVEQEVWELGPVDVETWAGTVRINKTGVVRKMTKYSTTTESKEFSFPEGREIGGAILGGLGGPLAGGGMVGLVSAFFMKRMQSKNQSEKEMLDEDLERVKRQRDEVIDGIEEAKNNLKAVKITEDHTAWDSLTNDLERKQSRDTIDHIRKKLS